MPPTPFGERYGPLTTEGLSLTLYGINALEDEIEWEGQTANYIEDYFNVGDMPGASRVWGVDANVTVIDEESSAGGGEGGEGGESSSSSNQVFTSLGGDSSEDVRRRRRMRRRREQEGDAAEDTAATIGATEESYVVVTYNQLSSYRTDDPEEFDHYYVATRPFDTREGMESYLVYLQELSTFYEDVTSIEFDDGIVRESGSGNGSGGGSGSGSGDGSGGGSDSTMIYIIVGVVCAVAVIVAVLVITIYRRRINRLDREHYGSRSNIIGNGPFGSGSGTLDGDLDGSDDSERAEQGAAKFRESTFEPSSFGGGKMHHIIAPAGKLGVIVDTPPEGGPAYVCEIKDSSPIIDRIHLEDKIIAVDDRDVRKMSAVDVSKMLARRSKNPRRKISILRGEEKNGVGESLTAASSSMADHVKDDNEEEIEITAPTGKLGVVLVSPEAPETGPAYVFNIRDDSPLVGKIQLGDKIVNVDDDDVRQMTAVNVSKLLGSKSSKEERKIIVWRPVGGSGSGDDEEPSPPALVAGAQGLSTAGAPSASSSNWKSIQMSSSALSGDRLEIIAPPGKLGVVVDSPVTPGPAYVSNIKDDCPIRGEIKLGDRILAVDDEDVSKLKAIHVSMLLGSKSNNKERKITVLRDPDDE